MPDVTLELNLPLPPERAFDVYVNEMDVWWPRRGVFPYSFAPKTTYPRHIAFEARLGGRYYETFADGSQYTIGHITLWQPPDALAYSWRDAAWAGKTEIRLRFQASGDGSVVNYAQDGFADAGVAWLIAYYQIGCAQTLAGYAAHCRAWHALEESGLSWD